MNQGTCLHFNGIPMAENTKTCEAGVCYHSAFNGEAPGIFLRIPCIKHEKTVFNEFDRRGQEVIPCHLYQEPTQQQIDAYELERAKSIQNLLLAIKVSSSWRVNPKPQEDRTGVVECPVCQGNLHLFQSSYNGHVSGKCETEKCIKWIE